MLTIKARCTPGDSVPQCAKEILRLANLLTCCVEVKFNGLRMAAYPGRTVADVCRSYELSARLEADHAK